MLSLIDPLTYSAYDKISDDLYWLSKNIIVRFNVSLSHYDSNGNRSMFHKEFRYSSNKSGNYLRTIRRSFDYYITIESYRKNNEDNIYIPIKIQDILSLRMGLQTVYEWFNDKKYEGLYVTKNGRLIMTTPTPSYIINHLPGGTYIEFRPIIIEKDTGVDDKEPGIYIGLSDTYGIRITIDRFIGFKYLIDTINMYQSAQLMLNYLQRPDLGSYTYSFTEDNKYNAWEKVENKQNNKSDNIISSGKIKRVLPNSNTAKSIDNLEDK